MKLPEHCYPLVREWRQRNNIREPNIKLHAAHWEAVNEMFYKAETPEETAQAIGDMVFAWCGCMLDTGQPVYRSEPWFWEHIQHQASFINADVARIVEMVAESRRERVLPNWKGDRSWLPNPNPQN